MKISLLTIAGCPNWANARDELRRALADLGLPADFDTTVVTSASHAQSLDFAGSPTITIDGVDLFPSAERAANLSCRVYLTPDGLSGWPTRSMIAMALTNQNTEETS